MNHTVKRQYCTMVGTHWELKQVLSVTEQTASPLHIFILAVPTVRVTLRIPPSYCDQEMNSKCKA